MAERSSLRVEKKKTWLIWLLCNFLPGEHMGWEGRGSHPSWAMVSECHSSQIVVYNRGNSSVSHITPLEVTLSCHPMQHDSDRASSAGPMYSTVIFARSDSSHHAFVESALLFCKLRKTRLVALEQSSPTFPKQRSLLFFQMLAKIYRAKLY